MLVNEMPHGGLKQSGYGKDMSPMRWRITPSCGPCDGQARVGGRAILPLGQWGVARATALFLAHGGSVELEFHPVHRISLGTVDLDRVKLVVGDGIKALHPASDVAVSDALNLKLMHAAEVGDLGKA
jgi:hypothetical protein